MLTSPETDLPLKGDLPKVEEMDELLTMDRFGKWVAEMPLASVIGRRRTVHSCPVSRYLISNLGNVEVASCIKYIAITAQNGKTEMYYVPVWVAEFIRAVDGNGAHQKVSRASALYVLRRLGWEGEIEVADLSGVLAELG